MMQAHNTLTIDIETYSEQTLQLCGTYKYASDPSFMLLLFGYSINGDTPVVVDVAHGEDIPEPVLYALTDPAWTKTAFHAAFERVCLSSYIRKHYPHMLEQQFLPPEQWRCSMVQAAAAGLPTSLDALAKVAGRAGKLAEGKQLIDKFCVSQQTGGPNIPGKNHPEWVAFTNYNRLDVELEVAMRTRLEQKFPLPEHEWEVYALDQHINDRGIQADPVLTVNAAEAFQDFYTTSMERAREITGLENPNSPQQLLTWLHAQNCMVENTRRDVLEEAAKTANPTVQEVLRLRTLMARSSARKYDAILQVIEKDGRLRGLFQYMGAPRTGRFAGRLVQVQNLPRNEMSLEELHIARSLILSRNENEESRWVFSFRFPEVSATLSQLVRTAFVPKTGCQFAVADFSSIEARVIAWLAGEQWRLELFRNGGDIYCESAANMFGVPVEKDGINAHLRQRGKVAELACGFGGAVKALERMGGLKLGLSPTDLQHIVSAWREANPNIVSLWRQVQQAAQVAVSEKTVEYVGPLMFFYKHAALHIMLPSGRSLIYQKPRLLTEEGRTQIAYNTYGHQHTPILERTYGGRLVENIVQAIARDLLVHSMRRVAAAGHHIVMHVHDEIVVETDRGQQGLTDIIRQATIPPVWAKNLPLAMDGYVCPYYRKE